MYKILENTLCEMKYTYSSGYKIEKSKVRKTYYKEYYHIDLTAFTNIEVVSKYDTFKKCKWNLDVAIEHENNYKFWCDEMLKLAFVSCPLRVVIAYSGLVDDTRVDKDYLDEIASVFGVLNECTKNNLKQGCYLVILGSGLIKKNLYLQTLTLSIMYYVLIIRNSNL